jgi:hypothetical protein
MEIVMGLLAVLVALSCLLILGVSEFKDYRKRLAEIRRESDETGRVQKGR